MAPHKIFAIIFSVMFSFVECQITSSPDVQTACTGSDVKLDWVYGNASDFLSVIWTHIDSSSNSEVIMQYSLGGGAASAAGSVDVVHNGNGGITLKNVKERYSGSYKINVNYLTISPVEDTVNITIEGCSRCPPICKILAILCAVFGVLGMMEKIGIFVIMIKKWLTRNVLLGIGVAGIGLFITSIGFGAAVLADDDCHEKCPDWVIKLPTAFVVISSLGIVFDIIIAILLLVGVIPAGENEEGGPDGPDGGHNGGGAPMAHSRVHAGHEETHRGSLSNRADSDSAVSRQDVHVQENQGHLSGRPMPAINTHQGQDKKGRGLSANFDDDHPIISISVPEKKAGDLGPLQEEPQKKRKKKKKRTDEE